MGGDEFACVRALVSESRDRQDERKIGGEKGKTENETAIIGAGALSYLKGFCFIPLTMQDLRCEME